MKTTVLAAALALAAVHCGAPDIGLFGDASTSSSSSSSSGASSSGTGATTAASSSGGAPKVCVPGAQDGCACCNGQGTGWVPCACPSTSASSSGGPQCDGIIRGTPCTEAGGHFCDGMGACVPFLPVTCQDDSSPAQVIGCDGKTETVGESIFWAPNHYCHGLPEDYGYCPSGTPCQAQAAPGMTTMMNGHCL